MSYILDALKKSEKERRRGALPDMLTVQDIVADKPSKRLPWKYLFVAALLLNAGALVWWLGFSHTNVTNVVEMSKTDNVPSAIVNESAQVATDRDKPSADSRQLMAHEFRAADRSSAPVAENKEPAAPVGNQHPPKRFLDVKADPASSAKTTKPLEVASVKSEQTVVTGRVSGGPTEAISEIPDENKLYKLQELPSAIRQNLPVFSVSALLYSSNPASRMVRINEHMMYEGEDLTAGVKLEEITRDGIILRYQKYRFYVSAK